MKISYYIISMMKAQNATKLITPTATNFQKHTLMHVYNKTKQKNLGPTECKAMIA